MPVQYRGILDEHRAVRTSAGLFDVSHMGEVEFRGAGALAALQRLTCNDVSRLQIGQIHYSALTTEAGTFVDDLTVYRLADDRYLVTLNAANIEKDVRWMREHAPGVEMIDQSDETALVAMQGPQAAVILQGLTPLDLAAIPYYWCARGTVAGTDVLLSHTGYTGEDEFEIYVAPPRVAALWDALLEAGGPAGLVPCGLGARDTTGVTGVTVNMQMTVIRELQIGPMTLYDLPIAFADVPPFKLFRLSEDPALLLGTDVLEVFRRVSLDFRARKVRFQLKRCGSENVTLSTSPSNMASRLASRGDPAACAP